VVGVVGAVLCLGQEVVEQLLVRAWVVRELVREERVERVVRVENVDG